MRKKKIKGKTFKKQTRIKIFTNHPHLKWLLPLLLFMIFGFLILEGFKKEPISKHDTVTVISAPKQKVYSGDIYAIMYPTAWMQKTNSNVVTLYNPHFLNNYKDENINISLSDHVYITTMYSNKTPQEYANSFIADNANYKSVQVHTQYVDKAISAAEIYREAPEGSLAYILILSNGKQLVTLELPTHDVSLDSTYNQIIASFKFISK